MDQIGLVLDGNTDEQTKAIKQWFGLTDDQSFQDLDVSDLPDIKE